MHNTFNKLVLLRSYLEKELGVAQSTIELDIFIIVMDHYLNESPLPIKSLFVESKHSSTGIRYHLDPLFDSGWLIKVQSNVDKRVFNIEPGKKLIVAFGNFYYYN